MFKRRKVRELALQVLFAWDAAGDADKPAAQQIVEDGTPDHDLRRDALAMANGAWDDRAVIDQRLETHAPQWPPRRQPGVDRAILRLAVWEMTHTDTPHKVVLDEAIELAKAFSTEQSPGFVNGVLDAILREHTALTAGLPAQ